MTQKARWLLFLPDKSSIEDVIRGINIPIDCEFLVAQHREKVVTFSEVYRVHATSPLEIHGVGNWSLADGLRWTSGHILHRRCNLRGQLIAATFARVRHATSSYHKTQRYSKCVLTNPWVTTWFSESHFLHNGTGEYNFDNIYLYFFPSPMFLSNRRWDYF
jgi:hypothetical protein